MGLRVFISSTYLDNRERRELVRDAVERARMIAVGMERFEASARPTVEECRRKAAECDLFVGIVAYRYGWEPDGDDKSISWIEYEAARAAGRPRLMFEIDPTVPFVTDAFDPMPDRWIKQGKLSAFKAAYAKDQMPALFREETLQGVVLDSLNKFRESLEPRPASVPRSLPRGQDPTLAEELVRYREAMLAEHATIQLTGFRTKLRVPIDLEDLYVPLRAMVDLRGAGEADFADAAHAEKLLGDGRGSDVPMVEAFGRAARLKRKGLVILGDPGSGKTTHLKRLVVWCLRRPPEELGLSPETVPVFLPLRLFADHLERPLASFIESQLPAPLGLSPGFGRRLLERGNVLLLFDGLDEVADPARRSQVVGWIETALRPYPSCTAVVTCRFAGYGGQGGQARNEVRFGASFLELHLRPLDPLQVETFVRNWYRIVETGLTPDESKGEQLGRERAEALLAELRRPDLRAARVAEMVQNPLLLANLCLVHRDRGVLPRGRVRLYEECVEVLLERWREGKKLQTSVSAEQGRRALQPAALWMHEKEGRTRASPEELAPVLEPALAAVRWTGGDAAAFLRTVRDESGLLTGWGPKEYGFMHLGFQEYFAACELRRRVLDPETDSPRLLRELAVHYGESWWQEVLLLFASMGNPSVFTPLMRAVVQERAFADHSLFLGLLLEETAEVTGAPFLELAAHDPREGDRTLWQRQRAALHALELMGEREALAGLVPKLRSHPSPHIQDWVAIYERTASSTDEANRLGDILVTEKGGVQLVPIPGGKFLMGSPEDELGRYDDEGPQRQVTVAPFYLGRFPVTNEEYGRYLAENPGVTQPHYWGDRRFNQARQPVVGVSWHDATAYAQWTGGRLPSGAEWEYACRAGTTTATYAGNLTSLDKDDALEPIAWYGPNSDQKTHPVGQKQPNRWGLHDTLGNVWEWCGDRELKAYSGRNPDYVARGGAYFNEARYIRAAQRAFATSGDSDARAGFRLARDR